MCGEKFYQLRVALEICFDLSIIWKVDTIQVKTCRFSKIDSNCVSSFIDLFFYLLTMTLPDFLRRIYFSDDVHGRGLRKRIRPGHAISTDYRPTSWPTCKTQIEIHQKTKEKHKETHTSTPDCNKKINQIPSQKSVNWVGEIFFKTINCIYARKFQSIEVMLVSTIEVLFVSQKALFRFPSL